MAEEFELDPELKAYVEETLGNPFGETPTEPDPAEEAPDEQPPADPGEEVGEEEEEGDGTTPSDVPLPSSIIEVAPGVAITRDQALSYYQFDALLKGRPELANEINDLVNGRPREVAAPEPASTSLEIPPEYADDPAIRPLYDAYAQQTQRIADLQKRYDEINDRTVVRDQEEIQSLIDQTRVRFQQEHGLSADEMAKVSATTERLNVLPSLLNGVDPITGQTGPRDRGVALTRAFEIAYWYLPEMRDKALQGQVSARAKSTQRKQRLAGVSGGGGGSVRQEVDPRKMTATERRDAMIREVAGLGGQEEN